MEGTAWDARQSPPARVAARTAQQPGLILAAAWVGGMVVVPMALLWRSLRGPARCSAGEHGTVGSVIAGGVNASWSGAWPLGCIFCRAS